MAVIKFGSIVTSGRGSLGGSTVQSCRSGHIWRNKPMPKKSRTQAQSVIRSYNKAMQAGWRSLTDQDRTVWNNFAINKPVFNRSGEKHPLSGHSLWLKYQFDPLSKGAPFMPDPSWYPGPYLGYELVKNGGFDDSSYWFPGPPWSISAGKAHYDASIDRSINQFIDIAPAIPVRVSFDISNSIGNMSLRFWNHTAADNAFTGALDAQLSLPNGSCYFDVATKHLLSNLRIYGYIVGGPFSFDNISIREFIS